MACIQVYFAGSLKEEVQLGPGVTRIGRNRDNTITIDNAGVSAHHAEITPEGETFVIEDVGSKNGVYVNGERVQRRALALGDEIKIFKHALKLVAIGAQARSPGSLSRDTRQVEQGATVEVDLRVLEDLKSRQPARSEAYLMLVGAGARRRTKHPLTRVNFRIGRARDCDIRTPGWFAPRLAARVVRKGGDFYLLPQPRGKVWLNDLRTGVPARLRDGDEIRIRGLALKFYHRAPQLP